MKKEKEKEEDKEKEKKMEKEAMKEETQEDQEKENEKGTEKEKEKEKKYPLCQSFFCLFSLSQRKNEGLTLLWLHLLSSSGDGLRGLQELLSGIWWNEKM